MTDNEIIKALEYCSSDINNCKKCPYLAVNCCTTVRCRDVLALVERQQEEIERLQTEKNNLIKTYKECMSDAIKEFDERLIKKSELMSTSVYAVPERAVFVSDIENIAKEMTGKEFSNTRE